MYKSILQQLSNYYLNTITMKIFTSTKSFFIVMAFLCITSLANAQWAQLGADIDGEAAGDRPVGSSAVSMSSDGSTVAIGAANNDGNGNGSGHVRVYKYIDFEWVQLGADINGEATDDQSGSSVSISSDGSTVAIGRTPSTE